jgi:hypothetical protein
MVFFSSARDHYFVAEAQGYADDKFPRLPDEVPPGICPKVLASQSTSAYSA